MKKILQEWPLTPKKDAKKNGNSWVSDFWARLSKASSVPSNKFSNILEWPQWPKRTRYTHRKQNMCALTHLDNLYLKMSKIFVDKETGIFFSPQVVPKFLVKLSTEVQMPLSFCCHLIKLCCHPIRCQSPFVAIQSHWGKST